MILIMDLIEVFKILNGFDHVDEKKFFLRAAGCISGHNLKLVKPGCRLDCRKFAFSELLIYGISCQKMLLHVTQ
jgi:hypothetical protein